MTLYGYDGEAARLVFREFRFALEGTIKMLIRRFSVTGYTDEGFLL